MFFVLFLWTLFWSLTFCEDRQLHAVAANGELGWIRLASAACGVNHRGRRPPTEKIIRSGDRLALFLGKKPESEATW